MSFWRRLFTKDRDPAARRLSLKELYQKKVRLYAETLTAGNAALEFMAQMQVRLHDHNYFSPAYVQVNCAMVLDHTRRVMSLLGEFTGEIHLAAAAAFDRIEGEINAELARTLASDATGPALPFEGQALCGAELLASGIVCPAKEAAAADALIIKAVWGWWPAVQNGMVLARRYRVAQGQVTETTSPEDSPQEQWLTYHAGQGFVMAPLPQQLQQQPCLEVEEARAIAENYRLLAGRYPGLKEVEWGLGPNREVVILQSLPHEPPSFQESPGGEPAREPLLFSQGLTIYPGRVSGPAVRLDVDRLPKNPDIPPGAVLFANKPALSLAPLLPKLAALVVETGDPHSHLAFLVRELRLPAVFALGAATSRVPEGTVVSVDAGRLAISSGPLDTPAGTGAAPFSPVAAGLLERLAPRLFSLNLGPGGEAPPAEACRSVHDLILYAAAVRRREMFCFTLKNAVTKKDAVNLVTGRLIPILVVDAGGGLAGEGSPATFETVSSVPFRAFLDGMMSIPWPKARPLDVKGFISVVGTTSSTPQSEDSLRRVSFALLSREYMNFSLCLGYHSSTIESYLGATLDSNFIRFHYEGRGLGGPPPAPAPAHR